MIPNIGPRGRRQRARLGWIAVGAAVVVAAGLFALEAPRMWRLVVFLPLWVAGLGFFQARAKT